jgi:hypothetical protein
MIIGTVLTACNLNPLYYDFIPLFVKSWNKILPYSKVKIILINDKIPESLMSFKKNIILFKPIEGINSAFIAQFIRILYPAILDSSFGVLTTDIDMIPMNRFYYENSIINIDKTKFITFKDQFINIKEFQICYNIALPKVWSEVFSINNINDINNKLIKEFNNLNSYELHNGKGWIRDQLALFEYLVEWTKNSNNLVILNDKFTNFNRLDRSDNIVLNEKLKNEIKKGYYSDYHMKRPFKKYININTLIYNLL